MLYRLLKISMLFGIVSFCFLACKRKDSPLTRVTPVEIDSIAKNYYEQYLKMYPIEATMQGDDRYNDLLPIDIDEEFISGEIAFYNEVLNQMKQVEYNNLTEEKKIVYDVLDYTLKEKIERYAYHPEYIPFTQFSGLPLDFPVMGSGQGGQPFKTEKDYDNWLKRMNQFPNWADTAIENFRKGMRSGVVLPKVLVIKMIPQLSADEIISSDLQKNILYKPLMDFPESFDDNAKVRFTREYQQTINTKIIPSYKKLAEFLEKEYLPKARDTHGYNAISKGEDTYAFYVKSWTTTEMSPEEIHQIGLNEVARIEKEMQSIQKQLGITGSLSAFLEFIKTDPKAMPYENADEVLAAFESIHNKIKPKLETMFSSEPKSGFEIRQTEAFRESAASAEYRPGTPDGNRPGIFYIPLPNPAAFNVTSGMESLFLHEAIPGHHYQISLQQENEKLPAFMRFGWIGAYGEGWALYTESLGAELGLYKDPYQRMGALSDEMLRAVRLVVDTGIHTGKMNREEAVNYFLSKIAYEKSAAIAEIERYMALPGQALSYKVGSMKIMALRKSLEQQMGENFSVSEFHDQILNSGSLPLSVLERKLMQWAKREVNGKN